MNGIENTKNHLWVWSAFVGKNFLGYWVLGTACGKFFSRKSGVDRSFSEDCCSYTPRTVNCELCKSTPIFIEACVAADMNDSDYLAHNTYYKEHT